MSEVQVRCFCVHEPLLAVCGTTPQGRGFVHVKAKRNRRLITEVVITEGRVQLRCRDCLRWHSIKIVNGASPELDPDVKMDGEIASMLEDEPVGG